MLFDVRHLSFPFFLTKQQGNRAYLLRMQKLAAKEEEKVMEEQGQWRKNPRYVNVRLYFLALLAFQLFDTSSGSDISSHGYYLLN